MINTKVTGLALAALLLSTTGIAIADEDAYVKECKEYAAEEKISAEEMDSYIEECVNDMKKAASEEDKPDSKD